DNRGTQNIRPAKPFRAIPDGHRIASVLSSFTLLDWAAIFGLASSAIIFAVRRPDRALTKSLRSLGDYIRNEEDDVQAPAGAPAGPANAQEPLFAILGTAGWSLLCLIVLLWLFIGLAPFVVTRLDPSKSGLVGDT